jgi:soluble lytic murein transglycosylase-like protein
LFRKRVKEIQAVYVIPDDLLCKMTGLESGWDPGAIGRVDNNDHGLVQINAPSHPDISIEQAIDPAFALNWAAKSMAANFTKLHDWDGVVAAHNLGNFYAAKWVAAGKPSSGGPLLTRGDAYTLATNYVALVRKQSCS